MILYNAGKPRRACPVLRGWAASFNQNIKSVPKIMAEFVELGHVNTELPMPGTENFSGREPVYVLWSDSGGSALPSGLKGRVKVTDYLGNEQMKPVSEIVLTESPVFIEVITKGL